MKPAQSGTRESWGRDHCVARNLELCRIVDLKRVKWIVGSEGKTSIRMARAHRMLQR